MSRPLDRQSQVYRENTDHVPDTDLELSAEAVHAPLQSLGSILLPDDHEAMRWDAHRSAPKTPAEADAALLARIADPSAPDDERALGAYDGLG